LAKEPSIFFAAILSILLVNMVSLHLAIDAQSSSSSQQPHQHWFAAMNATLCMAFLPFRISNKDNEPPSGDDDYDWNRSTEDNHKAKDEQQQQKQQLIPSKFRPFRQKLDRSYHCTYSLERQAVQDAILDSLLQDTKIVDAVSGRECTVPHTPWIVFTAGVYGAGKTHTIKKLHERGQFPLDSFVAVDPDEIRRRLPEFSVYVTKTPERAGELTRKEAGMMAEILTNFALEQGMNVLVDGSLKDAVWYENYFQKLRHGHPLLKIGIIHVKAPLEAILERIRQRGKETGRVVPMDALKRSIVQVPIAVEQLRHSVDFFLEIDNPQEPTTPILADQGQSAPLHNNGDAFAQVEIANTFQQKCAAGLI
jgi:predicted kinase